MGQRGQVVNEDEVAAAAEPDAARPKANESEDAREVPEDPDSGWPQLSPLELAVCLLTREKQGFGTHRQGAS
jgi:hypothetical protein